MNDEAIVVQKPIELEMELHEPSVRKNRARLGELLHDAFVEIGRSGEIYDKDRVMNSLDSEAAHAIWSQDYTAQLIGDGLVLLIYRSAHIGPDESLSRFSRRSSLWENSDRGWKLLHHQGTPTGAFDRAAT